MKYFTWMAGLLAAIVCHSAIAVVPGAAALDAEVARVMTAIRAKGLAIAVIYEG